MLEYEVTCSACPVQLEGTISGRRFYFRARWEVWRLYLACTDGGWATNTYGRSYQFGGDWPGAGSMDIEDALALIQSYGPLLLSPVGRQLLGVPEEGTSNS